MLSLFANRRPNLYRLQAGQPERPSVGRVFDIHVKDVKHSPREVLGRCPWILLKCPMVKFNLLGAKGHGGSLNASLSAVAGTSLTSVCRYAGLLLTSWYYLLSLDIAGRPASWRTPGTAPVHLLTPVGEPSRCYVRTN